MGIVTNPQAGDVHVNRPLTNFSQKWLQDASIFVGLTAFPNIPVDKQSDLYYEFNKDDFFRDEAEERQDGAESAGGSWTLSTNPYFARVYAYHKDVSDRQRANQDDQVQLDQSSAQYVTQKLLIRRERLFTTKFLTSSSGWTTTLAGVGSGTPTPGSQFLKWSAAASDPIADIRSGKRAVQQLSGLRPNKLLIGREAFDTLLENDSILSRVTGGANNNVPAQVMKTLVTQLFELDAIYVMDSIVNTSLKGNATQTKAFIGGDNALLYYAPDSVSLDTPTAAAQFSWTGLLGNTDNGLRIKKFRMEPIEADRVEGQMAFDYKQTSADLGYFFGDCS